MQPASSLPENIVLVGFMGTGKSSVGRLLARKLGYRFVDTDHLVVQRTGMEITEIFAQHGEAHFRDLETAVLHHLASTRHQVISTGGGIVLREENRTLLAQLGPVVELRASEEVIFERISRNSRRPLLQTENPRATVANMLHERHSLYAAAASLSVDTSSRTHDEVAQEVLALIGCTA
jgi:shikimate kinase